VNGRETETEIHCPFCGEPIVVLVDTSVPRQEYIEDCQVCCRPIRFEIISEEGELVSLSVGRDGL
jgi:hypothetical protein